MIPFAPAVLYQLLVRILRIFYRSFMIILGLELLEGKKTGSAVKERDCRSAENSIDKVGNVHSAIVQWFLGRALSVSSLSKQHWNPSLIMPF